MSDALTKFDACLEDVGPAAAVIREPLIPVEGRDGVLFPPTFAAGDGFQGGYNIDEFPDGTNICLVDSVGSQANRIEPIFARQPYAGLIPQIVVVAGTRRVNLVEAGHRAADALVRCSSLQNKLRESFRELSKGNARPLCSIAPTSLVFGVWDSRDTQAKFPRLVASTTRAFNVQALKRSAQFIPAVDFVAEGLLDPPGDKKAQEAYAKRGFVHVPASRTHGGVIAKGGVRRDATLHLVALRSLKTHQGEAEDLALRRYVLGLALTAFTYPAANYLRQGCNLVLDPDGRREMFFVNADGQRRPFEITHEEAIDYARSAAKAFGLDPDRKIDFHVPPDMEVPFEIAAARTDVSDDATDGTRKKKSGQSRESK